MDVNRPARLHLALPFVLVAAALPLAAEPPAPGLASGTFAVGKMSAKISHAAAFVDESDARKPVILVLANRELPAAGWKKESDLSSFRREKGFNGVAFWLDAKREVFRTDYFVVKEFPTSASGLFDLKLESGTARGLMGTARSTPAAGKLSEPVALDAAFHAVLK